MPEEIRGRYRVEVRTRDEGWIEVGRGDRIRVPELIGKAIDYPYRTGLRVIDTQTGLEVMNTAVNLPPVRIQTGGM